MAFDMKFYDNGEVSERDGSNLTYSGGSRTFSKIFTADEKIRDLDAQQVNEIHNLGLDADEFCYVVGDSGRDGRIMRTYLTPEIEACIAYARAEAMEGKEEKNV